MSPPALLIVAIVLSGIGVAGAASPSSEPLTAEVRTFFAAHCVACHGPEKQESDLRLDAATMDWSDPSAVAVWTTVIQRIEAGEMPPEERPRPPADRQHAAVRALRTRLLAELTKSGAAAVRRPRRLNRLEYQNSVRELLGIDLDLSVYLPEDGTAEGFDKVGEALSISPVLVERYLEAADVALKEAFIERPPVPTTLAKYTLHDCKTCKGTFSRNGIWAERDDAVLIWYTNNAFFYIEPFFAPVRGRYRIRISAYGTTLGEGAQRTEHAVQAALHGGNFKSSGRTSHLVDFLTMKWDEPQVFERVDLLEAGHSFKLTIAGQPRAGGVLADRFAGPALAVQWVTIEGPLPDDADELRRAKFFGPVDPRRGTQADADRILNDFAARAFRRRVNDADLAPYRELMHAQFAAGESFLDSLKIGLKSILCAPEFLFLDTRPQVDDYTIAARLGYFLGGGLPDAELRQLAAAGRLRDPQVRREQAERLLAGPQAAPFLRHFLDGWLDLKSIEFTTPDRDLYPEFDEPLGDAMLRETRAFFTELLQHDLSVLNLIDCEWAMLNERLARHYGIAGVQGGEIRKVALPQDSVRGGVMTQASILKVTADGTITSPVLRGVWLLERIMGRPVPPPPPGVPGLEPDVRGATTIREQLAKHRASTACAGCHKKIDPPGFALENFDPIGGWRDRYRVVDPDRGGVKVDGVAVRYNYGPPIESGDMLPNGRRFDDVRQFKQALLAEPRDVVENVAHKLATYALGRRLDFADHTRLQGVVDRVEKQKYGFRSLIKEIVADDLFVQ
jgi:mono/diheme cytochrome c family protein